MSGAQWAVCGAFALVGFVVGWATWPVSVLLLVRDVDRSAELKQRMQRQ